MKNPNGKYIFEFKWTVTDGAISLKDDEYQGIHVDQKPYDTIEKKFEDLSFPLRLDETLD